MPCQEPRGLGSYSCDSGMQDRIDELTQDLCYLCAACMEAGILGEYASPRILKWWKKHQIDDRDRVIDSINNLIDDYHDDTGEFLSPERVAEILTKTAEDEHPVSDYHKQWFKYMADLHVPKYLARAKKARKDEIAKLQKRIDKLM